MLRTTGWRRRLWRLIQLMLILAAVVVLWLLLWWGYLVSRYKGLFAQSEKFPRDYYVGEKGAPAATYVVMGDSTAYGTGAASVEETYPYQCAMELAARGFHVHVINISRIGDRVEDVLRDQVPRVEKLNPRFLTISVGANDATHFTNLVKYRADLSALITGLKRLPEAYIWAATTPDMAIVPALPPIFASLVGRRARAQNLILNSLVQNSSVRLVDLFNEGKLDGRKNPGLYAGDRFHPSAAGYRVWAGVFRAEMQRGGKR